MSLKSTTLSTTLPILDHGRPAFIGAVLKALAIWRERQQLNELDAHRLDDLGLSQTDVKQETNRPFWDAPNRWLR